jgi:hypothetical protein
MQEELIRHEYLNTGYPSRHYRYSMTVLFSPTPLTTDKTTGRTGKENDEESAWNLPPGIERHFLRRCGMSFVGRRPSEFL